MKASTTEEAADWVAVITEPGMPEKLIAWRQKLIEKENNKLRPLGIPIIKDRVAQMAVKLIIEPIFEADFNDCSYGYRPGRSAQDAVKAIKGHLNDGKSEVYDADLSGYFDSIPHDKLMACLRMRIVDGSVLRLIRQWLEAPVVEPTEKGQGPKVTRNDKGTPQGGVISPLLANLYLHWFKEEGQRLDFLGYSLRYDRDLHGRSCKYLNVFPSPKALKRARAKIGEMTDKLQCFKPIPRLIEEINRHLKGWANYYAYGYPRKAFRDMNSYVRIRLTKHLNRRSQRKYKPPEGLTYYQHLNERGLITL